MTKHGREAVIDETKRAEGAIAVDLKRLRRQLHVTAKAAWESEERHQLEAEIVADQNAVPSKIETTLRKFRVESDGHVLEVRARGAQEKAQKPSTARGGMERPPASSPADQCRAG